MLPFLQETAGGVLIRVKVLPRASRNEIAGLLGDELKVKVTAPPVDSAANEALIMYLSEVIGCPRRALGLVRGATARHKTISVQGVGLAELDAIFSHYIV